MNYRVFETSVLREDDVIFFYGAGHIAQKSNETLSEIPLSGIFDSSKNLQGTGQLGCEIMAPSAENIHNADKIIITSTAINEITAYLISIGYSERNIFISPVLRDRIAITELEELEVNLIFSSGSVTNEFTGRGGGLYNLRLNGNDYDLVKLYSGSVYGIRNVHGGVIFADTNNGVFKYDGKNIKKLFKVPQGVRAHGIDYDPQTETASLTCSYRDSIMFIDRTGAVQRELFISNKFTKTNTPHHHVNDHIITDGYAYVSMFSLSGNWKKGVFDGGVIQIDLSDPSNRHVVMDDLRMPHNIEIYKSEIHVLDSLRGNLVIGDNRNVAHFSGFSRGMTYVKDSIIAIGQSKNRNHSKLIGLSNNISIDCGIIFYDVLSKLSRQIILPQDIGEIHSIRQVNIGEK